MNQHTICLKQACDELNITYTSVGETGVFLNVPLHGHDGYFIANEVPFNNSMVARICEDKSFTNELLSEVIQMPSHVSFLDPDCNELYQPFVTTKTRPAILAKIKEHFSFPVIIKKNRGSQGIHVFKCENERDITRAIEIIFDKNSMDYDYLLLAQEYIPIKREFRVTVFKQQILLVYEKDFSQATFTGNLSPFHWEGATAKIITDVALIDQLSAFVAPIYKKLDLEYGGLDIVLDPDNQFWLLEVNTKPAYNYLVRDNGERVLIDLYKEMLSTN